jgi:hypothetical protein
MDTWTRVRLGVAQRFRSAPRFPAFSLFLALPLTTGAWADPPPYDWNYTFGTNWFDTNSHGDMIMGTAIAADGDILLCGGFGYGDLASKLAADFDPSISTDIRLTEGFNDIVVVRLFPSGEYYYAVTFGGDGDDMGRGIIATPDGGFIVAGFFSSIVDFDPGPGEAVVSTSGGYDTFVARFDAGGNLAWVKTIGGSGDDIAWGVELDSAGGFITFGQFSGTVDFDPGPGVIERTSAGSADTFVVRFTMDGDAVSVITFGGSSADSVLGAAVDSDGAVYACGIFRGTVDFDPGSGLESRTSAGNDDAYLAKFNDDGSLGWVWEIGSPQQDVATDVALTPFGEPIVSGLFGPSSLPIDFDPNAGTDFHQTIGFQSAFVTRLAPDRSYRWTRSTGLSLASNYIYANTVAVRNDLVVVGGTGRGNIDFAAGEPTPHLLSLSAAQGYLWAMSPEGDFQWVTSFVRLSQDAATTPIAIEFDPYGSLVVGGFFAGMIDLDPGPGAASTASHGGNDAFLVKLRDFHPTADYDGNERVDLRDLGRLFECFGRAGPGTLCPSFDFNENLRIDAEDYARFRNDFIGP